MQIIPVIDLKAGRVVHAKYGQREHYAPINTALCRSAELVDVIVAYLTLADFKVFYIADLDAIAGQKGHQALLQDMLTQFPHLTFWIDTGAPDLSGPYQAFQNHCPVIGSESISMQAYAQIKSLDKQFVLSLDFRGGDFIGPTELLSTSSVWPKTVIIMTLDLVGAELGPHIEKLKHFKQQFPDVNIVAAGGIRDINDVLALEALGISAALVATALHSGYLTREDLKPRI